MLFFLFVFLFFVVACCSLFVDCRLLCVVRVGVLFVCCLLLLVVVVHCWCAFTFVFCGPLLIVRCLLCVVRCALLVVCCLCLGCCFLWDVICDLLFVVC